MERSTFMVDRRGHECRGLWLIARLKNFFL